MDIQKYQKWVKEIQVIKKEVQLLLHHKEIFEGVQDIIEANSKIHFSNTFYNFLAISHVSHCVMSIRRLLKIKDKSISLKGLILDIANNPKAISLKLFKKLYENSNVKHIAEDEFYIFAEKPNDCLSVDCLNRDLQELERIASLVEGFADRHIAHIQRNDTKQCPTFDDLDQCISYLNLLTSKYCRLLLAEGGNNIKPAIQDCWQEIFKYPWINAA